MNLSLEARIVSTDESKTEIAHREEPWMARLTGKVAFITGAANGIGRAAAIRFAREGASVVIADRDPPAGEAAAREITAGGGRALALHVDVGDAEGVRTALAETASAFGPPTVLYDDAGGSTSVDASVVDVPLDEFWRTIRTDLFGTFLVCRFGIPYMIEAGGGSIINGVSLLALKGMAGADCYTAAKGGVAALTRSLAATYARQNIRVNAISPGLIGTERALRVAASKASTKAYITGQPFGVGQPDDIANAALYLASDEAKLVTGVILPVDSGMAAF
jgi:NAD(P)-dependent dehydrogenase (short-subunit alcohol dehydrogenase family)